MKALRTFFATFAFVGLSISLINAQSWFPPDNMQGNGTFGSPYEFTTAAQLVYLANYTNNIAKGDSTRGKYYKLMNDIDMTGLVWNPIGWASMVPVYFYGNFDGNSKVIRNLSSYGDFGGFFGRIQNAIVENLGIENCNINGGSAGGLAVYANNSTISICYVTGNVKGDKATGGLIGAAHCTNISNCYFSGNVSAIGLGSFGVGGLVGDFFGPCIGGDGGSNYHPIVSNCYVMGKVSAVSTHLYGYDYSVGGLSGVLSESIVKNCVVSLDSLTSNTNLYLNRIVGVRGYSYPPYNPDILQNNYALNTMVVQGGNGNVPIISHLDSVSGFSIPIDSLKSLAFYNRAANWYQMPWSIQNPLGVWKICDGRDLPFLRYQGIICGDTIIATAGINGTISPNGMVIVEEGNDQTFIFTPNTCYEIDSLWIDSVYLPDSITARSYTFNNITKNHTIEVSFKRLPPDTVIISDTICYGINYTENGFSITNAATDSVYFNNDFNTNGCDSVTRLELAINPLIIMQISDSICEGNFYDFHGDLITASGIYYDTLQAVSDCDSIIELTLTVHSIDTTQISVDICEGDNYDFFGRSLAEEGVYYQTLQTIHGCDSIIELTLTVEGVGIVEKLHATSLRIYPNPTTGKLSVVSYQLSEIDGEIEIFDVVGRKYNVGAKHVLPNEEIEIDISHLANGLYFLKIDNKVIKIVKQ